ncbi:MAG: hypothetical protein M3Q80_00420 [bacterium]|nr:hypothetical protein [bacterium]
MSNKSHQLVQSFKSEMFGLCPFGYGGTTYRKFKQAFYLVRKCQPLWSDPCLTGARNLRAAVAKAMKLVTPEEQNELLFYSAIGTPLSFFHGVDGWFEYRGLIVTVLLTKSRQIDSTKSGTVPVRVLDLQNQPETEFEIAARQIVYEFDDKQKYRLYQERRAEELKLVKQSRKRRKQRFINNMTRKVKGFFIERHHANRRITRHAVFAC